MRLVDINTAPRERIMVLRGIGPVRATRIVAARPFRSTAELVTRNLLSERLFDRLAAQLTSPGEQVPPRGEAGGASTRNAPEAWDAGGRPRITPREVR